jgi:F-type H+-transporting ATPase subunit a
MKVFAVSGTSLPEFPTFLKLLENNIYLKNWMHLILLWEDVIFSALIAILLSLFCYFGAKKKQLIPRGLQNFLELFTENLLHLVARILGPDAKKHLPFLGTLFLYIFTMNTFGLVPFMKSPSSSLSISIGMALCVFAYVQYLNIKNMGILGYIYHLCGSPKSLLEWILTPLMFPIELITQVSRPITLALRLTGNVMGEHALIGIFALFAILIFTFEQLPFGLPIQLPAMLFGLLTSLMQALVFTLLSSVYILLSKPHTHQNH